MNLSSKNDTNLQPSPLYHGTMCGQLGAIDIISAIAVVTDILLGLAANAKVVSFLLRAKGNSDLFVLNLALTELVICPSNLVSLLHYLNPAIDFELFALSYFFGFVLFARPLFQCCICLERYVAVVHPVAFLKHKALRYKLPCLASAWLLTTGLCTLSIFMNTSTVLTAVFLPVLAIDSFCSLSILRVLRQPRPGDGEREEMNLMKRRAFTTVLLIQITMVVNYSPMIIISTLNNIFAFNCTLFSIAITLLVIGSFLHPAFYLARAGELPCTKKS